VAATLVSAVTFAAIIDPAVGATIIVRPPPAHATGAAAAVIVVIPPTTAPTVAMVATAKIAPFTRQGASSTAAKGTSLNCVGAPTGIECSRILEDTVDGVRK